MGSGWIKLHRQLQEHWLWQSSEPFDKRSAWIDLIMSAMHSDTKKMDRNQVQSIRRGEYETSVVKLSERWGWSRGKVNRFLCVLENEQMLNTERTPSGLLITIVNYEHFQNQENMFDTANGQPMLHQTDSQRTANVTPNGHQTDSQCYTERTANGTHNKNDKNVNNINNIQECKEGKECKEKDIVSVSVKQISREEITAVIETWNELSAYGIQEVSRVDGQSERGKMLNARIKQYGIAEVLKAIQSIKNSDFLQGKNNRGWSATFDWFVRPNNFIKVLDGNYIKNDKSSNANESPLLNEWRNA